MVHATGRVTTTTRMCPNNASGVVWALGELFFRFFLKYQTNGLLYIQVLSTINAIGRAAMMKTGPNDTSGIVWALGEFFFHFFLLI